MGHATPQGTSQRAIEADDTDHPQEVEGDANVEDEPKPPPSPLSGAEMATAAAQLPG